MLRSLEWVAIIATAIGLCTTAAHAADYPEPAVKSWVAKNFAFHTGEVLPDLKITYTTIGAATGKPVLLLHGTMGSASNFLNRQYAGELFGAGQPLDAAKHYIIIPDAIGTGQTSKPSNGMRTSFPKYNYADMVKAHYLLLTEGLGISHVRLVMGSSMGGMQAWLWGGMYPRFMDALVPMSSTPTPMAGRNWLTRRLFIETIKRDPAYDNGNYSSQPAALRIAAAWFGLTTNGGTLAYLKQAPDWKTGDKLIHARLEDPLRGDANDIIYQYEASNDYDASPSLEKIEAQVFAVCSADDERNPIEIGLLEQSLRRVQHARSYIIPASAETRGHATVGLARLWKSELENFLASVP